MYNTNNLIEELLENPNMIVEGNREETVIAVLGNSDEKKYAKHREVIAMKESEYLEMGYDPVDAVRKAQSYWLKDFLADGVQEEGVLDRIGARVNKAKTTATNFKNSVVANTQGKQANNVNPVDKQLTDYMQKKYEEIHNDIVILLPKNDPETKKNSEKFVATLFDKQSDLFKGFRSTMNKISDAFANGEVYNKNPEIGDESQRQFNSKLATTPPKLPATPPPLPKFTGSNPMRMDLPRVRDDDDYF